MSNFLVTEYVIRIFDTRLSKLNCNNPTNVLIQLLLQIEIMKNLNKCPLNKVFSQKNFKNSKSCVLTFDKI